MRIAGTLAILLLWQVGAPSPSPSSKQTPDAAKSNSQPNAQVSRPASPSVQKNSTAETPEQNRTAIKPTQNEYAVKVVGTPPRSTGDTVALVCTILLTVVGIVGIGVGICTLRHIARQALSMRRQTTLLRKSANAAKASADALIKSERARLVAEFVQKAALFGQQWHRLEPYGGVSMSIDEVLVGKHLAYELKITNIGRTPGEIFQFEIGWGALNEGHPFSPECLSSKHTESINGFLGGGEARVFYAFNSHDIFRETLRGGEKGAIYVSCGTPMLDGIQWCIMASVPKIRMNIYLSAKQKGVLERLSTKTGAPIAELVRRAIDAYLLSRKKELK